MKGLRYQRGITAISMVVVVAVAAFFLLITLRLFPIYIEHFKVASHLENFAAGAGNRKLDDAEIRSMLQKRFDIDDVENVTAKDIFIEHAKDGPTIIAIEYEVRTPAFANVDMVVSFVDEVEVNP